MSLQGSLETFALPDVLVLLASTKKDGELRVVGGKVDGRIWVEIGQIVHSEVNSKEAASVDAVFELLRLEAGTFSFESDSDAPTRREPDIVDLVLADAQVRLGEWKEIAKIVPHLDVIVDMAAEAPDDEVTLTSSEWRLLRSVAGGCSVAELMRKLGRSEFDTCKTVKELIDGELVSVDVTARQSRSTEQASSEPVARVDEADVRVDDNLRESDEEHAPEPVGPMTEAAKELDALVDEASRPRKVRSTTSGLGAPDHPEPAGGRNVNVNAPAKPADKDKADEAKALVAQLAALEGENEEKIAKKVEEHLARGGELPEVPEGDEPINRGLLLKFLSSVRN